MEFIGCKGVCVGLSEVMASAGKSQLLTFMNDLIPTIRTALCDRFVHFNSDFTVRRIFRLHYLTFRWICQQCA